MAERTTSIKEADEIRDVLQATAEDLRSRGYDDGQIGAAMTGYGIGFSTHFHGFAKALGNLDAVRDALVLTTSRKH